MIRLPANRANELVRIERARKMILGKRTEDEEIREIAELLNMSSIYVREMLAFSRDMISLDATVGFSRKKNMVVSDFIEDRRYESPEHTVLHKALQQDIAEVLSTLSPKERAVLRLRFGLGGRVAMSLKDVGRELNLTKERIRQIEKDALLHLQHLERTMILEDYVA
jgi:DNA-directed RNA polymerase sigma subunit (sigma70/sigma32)